VGIVHEFGQSGKISSGIGSRFLFLRLPPAQIRRNRVPWKHTFKWLYLGYIFHFNLLDGYKITIKEVLTTLKRIMLAYPYLLHFPGSIQREKKGH
jgi:hypothetical protein